MSEQPYVRLSNISKSFGATVAVADISLEATAGEVIGLFGDNGSGKSTLMKILSGVLKPDAGSIEVNGQQCTFSHPDEAIESGILMVYQDMALCPELCALENIFMGQEITKKVFGITVLDWKRMKQGAAELLEKVAATKFSLNRKVKFLSGGQQKAVAISRVLIPESKVLIFDEPSAGLGTPQQQRVTEIVKDSTNNGAVVFLISHSLDEILSLTDRLLVLRAGKIVAEEVTKETTKQDILKHLM